jgi:hypothetical protein
MRSIVLLRTLIASFALLAVVAYLAASLPRFGQTTFDDAYIFVRYAKHALSGAGFCWNVGDGPSYGVTSVLHLLLVTALRGVTRLSDGAILTLISETAGLLAGAALVALGFLAAPNAGWRRDWIPVLVVPCTLLGSLFASHSVSGMETTLSLLCNSLLALAVVRYCDRRTLRAWLLCLVTAYAAFLARPDNGLVAWLFPALFLLATGRELIRPALAHLLVFGILLAADAAAKSVLLGGVVPLPYFAKARGFYAGYLGAFKWNAVEYLLEFTRAALPYFLVITFLASRPVLRRLIALFLPVAATFVYYTSVTQIMGYNARYCFPFLPYVVLGCFLCAGSSEAESRAGTPAGRLACRAVVALALVLLATSTYIQNALTQFWQAHAIGTAPAYEPRTRYAPARGPELPVLGWWKGIEAFAAFVEQVPPQTVLAASEYGYVGARFPGMTIVDLVGLQDGRIARNGFSSDSLFSREPDIIWLPHSDYSRTTGEILDHPEFRSGYDYYPGIYDYGVALRRASPRFDPIREALGREFARVYPGRVLADYIGEQVP